jgi:hypothetical protein
MNRKRSLTAIKGLPRAAQHAWHRGWLSRTAACTPYWCDVCQLGDAMYQPFVAALQARFAHRAADIEARACVRTGKTLAELDAAAGTDARADTGLRVMGKPVWRYQASGVCVCEAVVGDRIVLIYEPGALTRRATRKQQESQS